MDICFYAAVGIIMAATLYIAHQTMRPPRG